MTKSETGDSFENRKEKFPNGATPFAMESSNTKKKV
jgi:hypothetical protein